MSWSITLVEVRPIFRVLHYEGVESLSFDSSSCSFIGKAIAVQLSKAVWRFLPSLDSQRCSIIGEVIADQ